MEKGPPLLVNGPEARRLLNIGTTKYFELVKQGKLKAVAVGRRRHVTFESVQRLAAGENGGEAA